MRVIGVLLVLVCSASAEELSWYKIRAEVAAQLEERDLGEWARALAAAPISADVRARMARYEVFLRADQPDLLRGAVRSLKRLDDSFQSNAIDHLMDRRRWNLARYAIEQWPRARYWRWSRFLWWWEAHADYATIERWLAARGQFDRRWRVEWRLFRARREKPEKIVGEAAIEARERSDDVDEIFAYLSVHGELKSKRGVAWIGTVRRPWSLYDTWRLAIRMALWGHLDVACVLFERTRHMDFTRADHKALWQRINLAGAMKLEPTFRARVRRSLAGAYDRLGQKEKARALEPKSTLPAPGRQVRGPDDWLKQADRCFRQGDFKQAEQACAKAWALRSDSTAPSLVVRCSAYFARGGDYKRELAYLRARLAEAELTSRLGCAIVRRMVDIREWNKDYLRPTEEFWWRYLSGWEQWSSHHGEFIEKLGSRAAHKRAFWSRVETFAKDAHPSRAHVIGALLSKRGRCERAVPLLESAVARLASRSDRQSALNDLFDAYLGAGDWKRGEAILSYLDRSDRIREYARLALCAAKAGARDEAIRLWCIRANIDRSTLGDSRAMVAAGMRHELVEFYRRIGATRALWALSPPR